MHGVVLISTRLITFLLKIALGIVTETPIVRLGKGVGVDSPAPIVINNLQGQIINHYRGNAQNILSLDGRKSWALIVIFTKSITFDL